MKKGLLFMFVLLVVALCPLNAQAAKKAKRVTIKKTVVVGDTHTIYTPAFDVKKGKMTKLHKIKEMTVKKASKKQKLQAKKIVKVTKKPSKKTKNNYYKVKGLKAGKVHIDITTSNNKTFRYVVTVVKKPTVKKSPAGGDGSKTDTTENPSEQTSTEKYVNNGSKCNCGGAWKEYTITDSYKPSFWYFGYANNVSLGNGGQAQTWSREKVLASEGTCYYPLRVSAVEAGFDYHNHSNPQEHIDSILLRREAIPNTYDGKYIIFGSPTPITKEKSPSSLTWIEDRGGQYASISVDNYAKTQTVHTGYYICSKCNAIKQ